jgi:poly-beta-1,6-N-acetyl-D-glucosamine synthase
LTKDEAVTSAPEGLPSYAVITPVRDEAEHFGRTASAMASQTHRPLEWIIVDDGSTDGTRAIADSYASRYDWIRVVDAGTAHRRARGAPIVRAFNLGRSELRTSPDITVKLDGDLFFPAHYFAWVAWTFARDGSAGVVGGVAMIFDGARWKPDGRSTHNVNGVAKAYRTTCLDDIGGLRASMGWDGIDEYSARAKGWHVHVITELVILHYRPRGSKQVWYQARWEEGQANHYMGYRPSFLLVRALYRMAAEDPPILGGAVLAASYLFARLASRPQVDDPNASAELRREQSQRLKSLLRGRREVPLAGLPGGGPAFWFTGRDER